MRQRAQSINVLRGHLAEFGPLAPKKPTSRKLPKTALADEASDLPFPFREMGTIYLDQIARLGAVSKMAQTDIRRILIVGAMSVIHSVVRKGGSPNRWLARLVARKPKMVAAVALANKMAHIIWAMTTRGQTYRMA